MAQPLQRPKVKKIVLRPARASEIRSSLKIGANDKVVAHAAIVAVKKADRKAAVSRKASRKRPRAL